MYRPATPRVAWHDSAMHKLLCALVIAGCGGHAHPASGPAGGGEAEPFAAARWVPANPTYVVAAATVRDGQRAFHDALDDLGMVGGFTVGEAEQELAGMLGVGVSSGWAVDKDWLWVHFGAKGMGPEWFEHSHKAARAAWNAAWDWAKAHAGKAAVVGFAHAKDIVASTIGRVQGGVACVKQLEAIDRVGFSFDVDGRKVGARLTFDLGAAAPAFASHQLPPPPGWQAVARTAPR